MTLNSLTGSFSTADSFHAERSDACTAGRRTVPPRRGEIRLVASKRDALGGRRLERQLFHPFARRADEARHVPRRVAVLVHELVRARDIVEAERLAEAGIDLAGEDEVVQPLRLLVVRE